VVLSHGIVINNPVKFFSLEKYRKIIEINQTAPLLLVSELYRANKLAEGASVVFRFLHCRNTIGIRDAQPMRQARLRWSASPGAGVEFGHKGIRVNCISPGMVNTAARGWRLPAQRGCANHRDEALSTGRALRRPR
jgi:NAD(P)-dependent dehydrogenase (short-subunit alcohol dehydrogenase family)